PWSFVRAASSAKVGPATKDGRRTKDGPRTGDGPSTKDQGPRTCMRLGLIAGNGRFPFLVLDAARGAGHEVIVIALKEETFPDLAELAARPPASPVHWISLGQLGKCISTLKQAGAKRAVMAGQVKHTKLFAD